MFTQSRMTDEMREERREWREDFFYAGGKLGTSRCGRVTVALVPDFPGSRMELLTVAYASPAERRLRRKVGEYHARRRQFDGEFTKVPAGSDPASSRRDSRRLTIGGNPYCFAAEMLYTGCKAIGNHHVLYLVKALSALL